MGNDEAVIYGDSNGATSRQVVSGDGDVDTREILRSAGVIERTHWDSKLVIQSFGRQASIGIIPVDHEASTDEAPVYDMDKAQFMTVSRDGCNRIIEQTRVVRNRVYGKDA